MQKKELFLITLAWGGWPAAWCKQMPGNRPGYDPSLQKIVLDQPVPVRIQYKTKRFKKGNKSVWIFKTALLKN